MKKIIATIIIILMSSIIGTAVLAVTGRSTTDGLNIRDGASTSANKIGTIDKNKKINIIEEEGNWYKIQYNDEEAYVIKNYVELEETSENATKSEIQKEHTTTKKLEEKTTLYILPLINSLKLSTLEEGTEITIISDNGKWLYIQTDKESGWITSNNHYSEEREEKDTNGTEKNEQSNSINEVNQVVEKNETTNNTVKNEVINETLSNNEKNAENDTSSYPTTMYVSVDSAYIRKSASSNSEVISGTSKNSSIKVIGKEGDWYKVSTEDCTGYIRSDLLSTKKN